MTFATGLMTKGWNKYAFTYGGNLKDAVALVYSHDGLHR
jgi:hypothetical protein